MHGKRKFLSAIKLWRTLEIAKPVVAWEVCVTVIYPAAYRPDWIMAAAGFSTLTDAPADAPADAPLMPLPIPLPMPPANQLLFFGIRS